MLQSTVSLGIDKSDDLIHLDGLSLKIFWKILK